MLQKQLAREQEFSAYFRFPFRFQKYRGKDKSPKNKADASKNNQFKACLKS
jgi:hypothetical protein